MKIELNTHFEQNFTTGSYTSRKVAFEHQAIVSKLGSTGPFGHQAGAQMVQWNQALIL
jgi:hypothetical protein